MARNDDRSKKDHDSMKLLRTILSASLLAYLLIGAFVSTVSAQTFQAQITGVVRDPSGAVIPNAQVVATNVATRVSYSTESNAQGIYRLLALPPARYKLSVALAGFKTFEQGPITLQVNDVVEVEVTLQVGDAAEKVEVN